MKNRHNSEKADEENEEEGQRVTTADERLNLTAAELPFFSFLPFCPVTKCQWMQLSELQVVLS